MSHKMKATDKEILDAYESEGSVWKASKVLDLCGQSVHERLQKMGKSRPVNKFTKEDEEILLRRYLLYRDAGRLQDLADIMGRHKTVICEYAKKLGLTDPSHKKVYIRKWKYMEIDEAGILFEAFKKSRLGLNQYCKKMEIPLSGFTDTMRKYFADEWDHVIELKTPKSSKYRLGRQVEYAVRDDFRKHGWFAIRSPASRSPVDITAIKTGAVVMVQCKRGMTTGIKEWNDIFDLAQSVGAMALIAGRPTGRGLLYWRINARKDGSRKKQPKTIITLDEL